MTLKETGYNSIVCITPCNVIKENINDFDRFLQQNSDMDLFVILPAIQTKVFEISDRIMASPYKEQAQAVIKILFKLCVRLQKRLQASK